LKQKYSDDGRTKTKTETETKSTIITITITITTTSNRLEKEEEDFKAWQGKQKISSKGRFYCLQLAEEVFLSFKGSRCFFRPRNLYFCDNCFCSKLTISAADCYENHTALSVIFYNVIFVLFLFSTITRKNF